MEKVLADLIKVSNAVGKDATLTQGGGGNTSMKTDDGRYMYIKASGTALKDMNARRGWRRMRLDSVRGIISDKAAAALDVQSRESKVVKRLLSSCDDEVTDGSRPSVEAHLHSFLNNCVIHLHADVAGAYVNARNGRAELEKLFKDEEVPPLWVPYTDPGFMLARRISRLVAGYRGEFGRQPTILFLEKHGVFLTAETAEATLKLVRRVIKRCSSRLSYPKADKVRSVSQEIIDDIKLGIGKAFFKATGRDINVNYFCDDKIAAFWRLKDAKKLLNTTALTPDELLYAGGPPMWLETIDSKKIVARLSSQIGRGANVTTAFLVNGVGLFVAATEKMTTTVREVATSSLFVRFNANRMGGIFSLNQRQQDFINNWEAEAFRRKLASGTSEGRGKKPE